MGTATLPAALPSSYTFNLFLCRVLFNAVRASNIVLIAVTKTTVHLEWFLEF